MNKAAVYANDHGARRLYTLLKAEEDSDTESDGDASRSSDDSRALNYVDHKIGRTKSTTLTTVLQWRHYLVLFSLRTVFQYYLLHYLMMLK